MKTKSFLFAVCAIALSVSVSAADLNPSYCTPVVPMWSEYNVKATVSSLPTTVSSIWCAFTIDWKLYADLNVTFTPGATTFSTPRLNSLTWYNDKYQVVSAPTTWPGGAVSNTKPGFIAFCIQKSGATYSKGQQECTAQVTPSNFTCTGEPASPCVVQKPSYCDNFRSATNDFVNIQLSGMQNYTNGNWFVYVPDPTTWNNWADFTGLVTGNTATIDMSKQQLVHIDATTKKQIVDGPVSIPLQSGALWLQSGSKADGTFCVADNKGGNAPKSGIDVMTLGAVDVPTVAASELVVSPNPASASDELTVKGSFAANATVTINNISGQTVATLVPSVDGSSLRVSLANAALVSGYYILQVQSEGTVFVGKLSIK